MQFIIFSLMMWGLLLWLSVEIRSISLRRLPWLHLKSTNGGFFKLSRTRRYFLFEPSHHNATHARQFLVVFWMIIVLGLGYSIVGLLITGHFFDFLVGLVIFLLGYMCGLWQYGRLLLAAAKYWQSEGTAEAPFTLSLTDTSLPELKHHFNKVLMITFLVAVVMLLLILGS